jgi:hypothetical protein
VRLLPAKMAMGRRFATDAGHEDTSMPLTFLRDKNGVALLLAANLPDKNGQSL